MHLKEAKTLILIHGSIDSETDPKKFETGFLGMLRPYTGLQESNFREVMQALRTLAPEFQKPKLPTDLFSALWGMCHYARAWGLDPDGMLRSNNLLSGPDQERLETWVGLLSDAVARLLDGDEDAFEDYDEYLKNAQ